MSDRSVLPRWPPVLSQHQLDALTLLATTYALSHGLIYLPEGATQPPVPTSAIHAPIALFPTVFPRELFDLAHRLQPRYNVLYARVALDEEFLDRVMGEVEGVGRVDEFTGNLWRRWKRLRDEGITQPRHLGLFRSDYLPHAPGNGAAISLKQVEFNTISSSFGPLSENVAKMHRYLLASTDYFGSSPILRPENLPSNHTISGLAEGLAAAHKAYTNSTDARILFVVQDGERNVFDQRWLEYELLEKHSIHVVRQTLDELATSAHVYPISRVLRVKLPHGDDDAPDADADSVEISTVYFRAGYTPRDYPTDAHYETRYLLERSIATKCPSIALQLAGGKKVQEVLAAPGALERFLGGAYTPAEIAELRASFMGMWGLDADDGNTAEGEESAGVRRAREGAPGLVLKPQREGGGNNVYKEAIPPFLDALPAREREAWIAMELIRPPEEVGNYLVRAGGGTAGAVRTDVVSELGIFGWALFGGADGEIEEKAVGWLLRTKGKESNEGGIAAGFSVLDSVVLVD